MAVCKENDPASCRENILEQLGELRSEVQTVQDTLFGTSPSKDGGIVGDVKEIKTWKQEKDKMIWMAAGAIVGAQAVLMIAFKFLGLS